MRDRQYAADMIAVALLEFDLFSWLDQRGRASTAEICETFDIAARPTDVMLTLCRAGGLICSRGDVNTMEAVHALTSNGREHMVASSPWFLGPYYKPIQGSPIYADHLKVLRSGRPANWQAQSDGDDWHESMMDPDFAKDFTAIMNCRGLSFATALADQVAPQMSERRHVLDVGGGSGVYCAALVAANQQLRGTVLEQAPVDAIARSEIEQHGLSNRIAIHSGDMFVDDWPTADVVLLSNVLHDWDLPQVRQLCQAAADTLPDGGLLIVHEAFLHDDKTGPLPVAEYSVLLANITQGKCYSVAEYAGVLDSCGFEVQAYRDTIADRGYFTAIRRPR